MYKVTHLLALVVGLLSTTNLQAAEQPYLVDAPNQGFRLSSDPVQVRFPSSTQANILKSLRFEIDAMDVTEFVTQSGRQFTYTPAEQLSPGHHEMRVVSVSQDGNMEEMGVWAFEVRHSVRFREASIEQNLDIQATHKLKDGYADDTDNSTVQGAWSFNTVHADGNWRISSQADFLYNQKTDQASRGEEFDLNAYLFKADLPQTTFQLGHHQVGNESLILSQFNRRGLSARAETEDRRFNLTGFSMRTESITGFQHGVGFADSNNTTNGIIFNSFPFASDPGLLALSAIYLSGDGRAEGVKQVKDDVTNSGGDAVALIADSTIFDRTLRLRAEVAETSYDFDGKNTGYASKDDGAYSLLVHYTPQSDSEYSWDAGIKYQMVSPWFHSPGFSDLVSDQEETQVFANFSSGEWSLNTILSRKYDNVDDDVTLPEIKSDIVTANISYTPVQENEYDGFMRLFSNAGYNLSISRSRDEQENQPAGFLGQEINTMNREANFQASFSADEWSWSIGHGIVLTNDNTDASSDTENRLTTFDVNFPLGQKVGVGLQLQQNKLEDIDTAVETDTDTAVLSLTINHPANWTTTFSHTLNREQASDDSVDTRSNITEASMRWDYLQASGNKPGMAFFVNANYQTSEDNGVETSDYQAFIGFNITWAAKY
ncbi:MAG: hypothetical protein OEW89_09765 [Gammaproteobacteria bacterium]|nr:hypothetical protein [Gammaproteobacteria bacterium]